MEEMSTDEDVGKKRLKWYLGVPFVFSISVFVILLYVILACPYIGGPGDRPFGDMFPLFGSVEENVIEITYDQGVGEYLFNFDWDNDLFVDKISWDDQNIFFQRTNGKYGVIDTTEGSLEYVSGIEEFKLHGGPDYPELQVVQIAAKMRRNELCIKPCESFGLLEYNIESEMNDLLVEYENVIYSGELKLSYKSYSDSWIGNDQEIKVTKILEVESNEEFVRVTWYPRECSEKGIFIVKRKSDVDDDL